MGLDDNYKRAVIKLANKEIPDLTNALNRFLENEERLIRAMSDLARALRNMPRSVRMRP